MAADDALALTIRRDFPIFASTVYLNSCSQGALSVQVRDAYAAYLRDWEDKGSPWEYWVERMETMRSAFAALVGAGADEIAVTTSASAGVSALASGLRFDGGRDKVVISDFEFPTIGQIWHAQEARGVRVEHVHEGPGTTIPLEAFDKAIDDQTALVSVTQVCYRNGSRLDLPGIIGLAHERGAQVLVDASQAVGAVPIDVRALGADYLVGGTLKYLLGSAGLAFLYCRADLLGGIVPTTTGWFADADIFAMDIHDYSPHPSARRFDAGTPPVPNIYAGIAGVGLVSGIGVPAIAAHVQGLNDQLIAGVDVLGGVVVTPRDPALRGPLIAIAATEATILVDTLAAAGLLTSERDGNLRVSPHAYNTTADIDALLSALARHDHLLRR